MTAINDEPSDGLNGGGSVYKHGLADFITANMEPLLQDWEEFAQSLVPGEDMSKMALRDHAREILGAVVADMASAQSQMEQEAKGKGRANSGPSDIRRAAESHALTRIIDLFTIGDLIAEFRAIRASVLRRWAEAQPPDGTDIREVTRFNEAIDQTLAQSVELYSAKVEEARGIIIGVLAHDLRTPLTSIGVSAESIARTDAVPLKAVQTASRIQRSVSSMTELIEDLLDYTSTRLGRGLPLNFQPCDIKSICEEVVEEVRAAHPERIVGCQVSGDTKGTWDGLRLHQMLSNLTANALAHGRAGADVSVDGSVTASEVLVKVHNFGHPIPPAAFRTLFEPLKRAEGFGGDRMKGSSGLGLGLYIAAQIAQAHGGRIEVKSSAEAGTTFTVVLPRTAA
jgi:signal transduction histidine kinase